MDQLLDVKKFEQFCAEAAVKCGLHEDAARSGAAIMVRTDMFGVSTHGTVNLAKYLKLVKMGAINGSARPSIENEGSTWTCLDGNAGYGMYNGVYALEIAMKKAEESGMAIVTVKNSGHFGGCGPYAVLGAERGFITFMVSNADHNMSAPGSKISNISNAPMAYAIPMRDGEHPVFMDLSMGAVAKLKVLNCLAAGKPVPEGWIIDCDGNPTTKPDDRGFSLLPMGGHKGYCLAFLVEVLCTVLSGGDFDVKAWPFVGENERIGTAHCVVCIDTKKLMPMEQFAERMDKLVGDLRNSPKAPGFDHIFAPGDIDWGKYDRAAAEGLALPDNVFEQVMALASMADMDLSVCYK